MKLLSSIPNVDAPTANQDVGVARDDVTPGDGTGTPVRQDWQNDLYYGLRAMLNLAGLTPDNSVEGVTSSQVANALQYVVNGVTKQRNNVTTNYTILDTDFYRTIFVDTTAGDITITLPLLTNNYGRRIKIVHVKSAATPNKVIIAPNAGNPNSLTNNGLSAIWLPKIGDHIDFAANDMIGALIWEAINERISNQLRLDTFAGHGSTDTKIIKFTNSRENFGNLFSHNHGAYGTAGLEITANRSGRYSFTFATRAPASIGLSLNSSQLTTNISAINVQDRLCIQTIPNTDQGSISWTGFLKAGDIIRPHTAGVTPATNDFSHFTAIYLGN
jgi:hypothetical protein